MKKTRSYALDNLKFLLIFLVVFGHFLEITPDFHGRNLILRFIYSFHMPAFLFLAGWFGKFRPRRIVFQFLYTYLLFQVIYLLSSQYLWTGNEQTMHFSAPYWLLWYLAAMAVYELLLPLVDVKQRWKQAVILLISAAVALYSGTDNYIGYIFSSGRILTFLPFYLLGFYWGQQGHLPLSHRKKSLRICGGSLSLAAVVLSCLYLWWNDGLTLEMMYGSNSYEATQSGPLQRVILMVMALGWICFLLLAVSPLVNRKLPLITAIGGNTFSVFLLHGLVIRYLGYCQYGFIGTLPMALGGTVVLLIVFGNPWVAWFFRHFLTGWWAEWLWNKASHQQT